MQTKHKCRWEHFSHDADIGVRGIGDTIENAFSQAALALTATICDIKTVHPDIAKQIHCEAPDYELLFVDWLNALVYEMAVSGMLFSRFEIQINKTTLDAHVWGETVNPPRHQPSVEVKGATYTELIVMHDKKNGWLAQCVIDV